MKEKRTAESAQRLLATRRERLARLIDGGHADIIIDSAMFLLAASYVEVNGRGWNRMSPLTKFRAWIRWNLDERRCECGGFIWPWQKRAYDDECGWVHRECGDPEPERTDAGTGER